MPESNLVFRALPGIADVSDLLDKIAAHPNPFWAPENDNLPALVDKVSKRLFGITMEETEFDCPEDFSPEQELKAERRWNEHFYFIDRYNYEPDPIEDDPIELQVWELLGWDVTDGAGKIHHALEYFNRQMICASKGLLGRLPSTEPSEEELRETAERWAASLLESNRRQKARR